MEIQRLPAIMLLVGLLVAISLSAVSSAAGGGEADSRKTYIIQMERNASHTDLLMKSNWYRELVSGAKWQAPIGEWDDPVEAFHHVYENVFHGFSAHLTADQAEYLRNLPGVLNLHLDRASRIHTTHTPEFLGLSSDHGLWPEGRYGEDVIIGMIDTGIWPERLSFNDRLLGPIPKRWKGSCVSASTFDAKKLCNKKLIGARYFAKGHIAESGPVNSTEYLSPRDINGHGTHTASTAAGRWAYRANVQGFGQGTARGMAPKARIAVYKACWSGICLQSDVLAAIDQAVADGVDVISMSIGETEEVLYKDLIAIGAYGAVKKGIFVSTSAGNEGYGSSTVQNVAPWITTVGATTTDRFFPGKIVTGNGSEITGKSLYVGKPLTGTSFKTLIFAGDGALANMSEVATNCAGGLNPALIKGKIVVCVMQGKHESIVDKALVVGAAGGVGCIVVNTGEEGEGIQVELVLNIPTVHLGLAAAGELEGYIRSTNKTVVAFKLPIATQFGVKPAPAVASFSSRGPSSLYPGILKPDIVAPGVDILAAYAGDYVTYAFDSGTSMACPHISGLGAVLKAAHPSWSPAAIRSAMMTSATILNNQNQSLTVEETTGTLATPLDYGAGFVQPNGAVDPGLIYDLSNDDYLQYLCALGYPDQTIRSFDADADACPATSIRIEDFNYPSFSYSSASFTQTSENSNTFKRTVTNVGHAKSIYTASVDAPKNVTIVVSPSTLSFTKLHEKKSFTVTVTALGTPDRAYGFLTWSDGSHKVQSPITFV